MKKLYAPESMITAIDIGTTKICVLVAQATDPEIIGIGKAPSDGLKKGVVVNIAKTVQSIKAAVAEAQLMAGCTLDTAYIGISGGHIQSFNSHGVTPVKGGQIGAEEITSVLDAAKAIAIPEGQQLLHVLPQYYTVDGQHQVVDPRGMYGVRLEAYVHLITGSVASVQNLIRCCELAGVNVTDIILEQLASADAVLTDDERELGVAMLDIGGGTSDLAIYQHGSIRHTMVLPVAGNHVTHDLAIGLQTTVSCAEQLKKEHGTTHPSELYEDYALEITDTSAEGTHTILASEIQAIIKPRMQEIFTLVRDEIKRSHMHKSTTAGLVLTGGGSLPRGAKQLAQEIFAIGVRIGNPRIAHTCPTLESPLYATGYGLLIHALKKRNTTIDTLSGPMMMRVLARMKSWVSEFF
jgi:cell division protein FtsA